MPKVSVILPVYNVEKYIREALDSVVNQTLRDIEIICVDDCSTDNSYEILQEYAQKDSRFVVLKQEVNQGPGVARNRGLDVATGDYIMFLDPDDWYELDACESAYNQIVKNNNDFAYFNFSFFIEKEDRFYLDRARLKLFEKDIDNPHIRFSALDYQFWGFGECIYKIYKNSFLKQNFIKFGVERFCEDLFFYVHSVVCANDVSILNKSLYNYRIHNNNTIFKPNYKDLLSVHIKNYETCKNSSNPEIFVNKYVVYSIKSLMYWYKQCGEFDSKIKKDFYSDIKMLYKKFINEIGKDNIKKGLNKKAYKKFRKFVEYDFIKYNFQENMKYFIKQVFSIENHSKFGIKHKVITISGIKIKIKMKER